MNVGDEDVLFPTTTTLLPSTIASARKEVGSHQTNSNSYFTVLQSSVDRGKGESKLESITGFPPRINLVRGGKEL